VGPDHHDIRHGLKLALVAISSAVVVAGAVIGAGHAFMGPDRAPDDARIIQVGATG
jgi:hypothetical protein